MKQRKMKQIVFLSLMSMLLLGSCTDRDVYQGGGEETGKNTPLKPSEVFDFSMMQQVKVNVDYGFAGDYYITFDLYSQDPMKEENDSWIKDESLSPVYSAPTDKKGRYSGTVEIPSDITEVWLYTDYLGAISPVKLTISNGEINYNQSAYIASLQTKTRGTTTGGHNYLDDWMLMPGVDWDGYGVSNNMEAALSAPPAEILYSIRSTYSNISGRQIKDLHPEWLNNNTTSEIKIIKDTELSLVFVASSASFNNTVGYFTYKSGTVPTPETVQKVLAFPNASPISKVSDGERTGSLLCGHEVKLKYWNEDEQKFEDKFPAGVTVGWSLQANAFKSGDILKGIGIRYSYSTMNYDNSQRVVALRDGGTDQIVAIGFEDNVDFDYCDATFYLKIAEANAIDPGGPELPPVDPPSNVTTTYKGTLAYEDQWPAQKDYDMNDVVMTYQSTLYRNVVSNKIYKIVDEFIPLHSGGTHICGFGYQLHNLTPDRVRSIEVSGPDGWKIETAQSHPTVILFDNMKSVLNQKFTVTIELADVDLSQVTPPYNPFIFVNGRSREVHLVNYAPTDKADKSFFNTSDDMSNIDEGIYYITRYGEEVDIMPFAINLPILDFSIPTEGVKIYDTYPDFIGWVKSKGTTNKNWYKNKK
ncbi:LruC domain-containing protein [Bacteroides intestinalis]|uniref:LruC domain-containing protein n=1 Tax=Bacteroides intestinalis TaxID=329854 RepID=A0AB37MIB4_9BACE|nr:LruC domain-containing protein [Bacteroides intestinalis]RHN10694.1 LruC domain-containing protein [Bacteroides intestinalis]